jgi:hypothetical protein
MLARASAMSCAVSCLRSGRLAGVFLAEFLDPARGVDNLLLARVERVARRTDFNVQGLRNGRARSERVAATTSHLDLLVVRVNSVFHNNPQKTKRIDHDLNRCQ